MNDLDTALWAALGALAPIIVTTIGATNYFSSKFEALGDRIELLKANFEKQEAIAIERRQAQHDTQVEYREHIEYLIHANRERADHHRQAMEKLLQAERERQAQQLADLRVHLEEVRSYLNSNSDYMVRKPRTPTGD